MARAVDVAGDDVAAEARGERERPLEVDRAAFLELCKRRAPHRLRHDVGREVMAVKRRHRQADAIDGDAVAELRAFQDFMGLNGQADGIGAAVHMGNRPQFLNDASEHRHPPCWHYMP